MNVWRLSYHDPEAGMCFAWATSKRAATKAARQVAAVAQTEVTLDQVNVPIRRDLLVAFLNENAVVQDGFGDCGAFPQGLIEADEMARDRASRRMAR